MSKKIRGSEKMMFDRDKNGKRSLADFENMEEALQASGGFSWDGDWCGTKVPGRIPFPEPVQVAINFGNIGFPQGIPVDRLFNVAGGQFRG